VVKTGKSPLFPSSSSKASTHAPLHTHTGMHVQTSMYIHVCMHERPCAHSRHTQAHPCALAYRKRKGKSQGICPAQPGLLYPCGALKAIASPPSKAAGDGIDGFWDLRTLRIRFLCF
jgi:hypothetical protein